MAKPATRTLGEYTITAHRERGAAYSATVEDSAGHRLWNSGPLVGPSAEARALDACEEWLRRKGLVK